MLTGTITAGRDRWTLELQLGRGCRLTQEVRATPEACAGLDTPPTPAMIIDALVVAVRPIVERAGVSDATIEVLMSRRPIGAIRVLRGRITGQVTP